MLKPEHKEIRANVRETAFLPVLSSKLYLKFQLLIPFEALKNLNPVSYIPGRFRTNIPALYEFVLSKK